MHEKIGLSDKIIGKGIGIFTDDKSNLTEFGIFILSGEDKIFVNQKGEVKNCEFPVSSITKIGAE